MAGVGFATGRRCRYLVDLDALLGIGLALAAFGRALAMTGLAFRFAAPAHSKAQPRRWWLQVLPLLVGYIAFGLAASTSSVLDRM